MYESLISLTTLCQMTCNRGQIRPLPLSCICATESLWSDFVSASIIYWYSAHADHMQITCRPHSIHVDHIAVQLFLLGDIGSLTLHLPCPWDNSKSQFLESSSKRSPGAISNTLHRMFSSVVKEDSLKQINDAIQVGAVTQVHNGFLKRNCSVAMSEYLVAFTWGKGSVPKEGGTLDTWMKCKGRKVHIPLDSLLSDGRKGQDPIDSLLLDGRKRQVPIDSLLSDGRKRQVPIDSLLSDVGTSVVEREQKRMKRCEEVKLQKPST